MNVRERVLEALTWGEPDYVPWVVKPNHLPRGEWERELRSRGMGLSVPVGVVRVELEGVEYVERRAGDRVVRVYRTPVGEVREAFRIGLPREAGERSDRWRVEHFIKGPEDYRIVEYLYEHMRVSADYRDALIVDRDLGGDGVTYTEGGYSPLMEVIVNLMGFARFSVELKRSPGRLEGLLEVIWERKLEIYRAIAESPVRLVLVGDNIDEVLVDPRLFKRYCLPFYQECSDILRSRGKIVGSHMDGRLRGLKELIAESGLDFVHGFTPPPGGNLSLREAREAWGRGVAIWVNIPEATFYWSGGRLAAYLRGLLREAAPGHGLVLGITETVPPERRREAYETVTDVVLRHGRIPTGG